MFSLEIAPLKLPRGVRLASPVSVSPYLTSGDVVEGTTTDFGRASLKLQIPGWLLLALPGATGAIDEVMAQLVVNALTNMTKNSTQAANAGGYSRFTFPYDCELHPCLFRVFISFPPPPPLLNCELLLFFLTAFSTRCIR